jgi:phage terminase large subunit-like protein
MWSLACPDWEDRIQSGWSLIPDLPLFRDDAERAVGVFNLLRLPDVMGMPTLEEAAGDWFRDIVRAIFGSYDRAAKKRFIREVFALVAKKQSKTTGAAAIMLTALLLNEVPRAQFIIIGPTKEVADVAFGQAVGMIDADQTGFLKGRLKPRDHIKVIENLVTGAKLKIKTFDTRIVTGAIPSGVLIDELHIIATMRDADRIIGQLRGGMLPKPEAFIITITTQSERAPTGIFKTELHKARAIRDGEIRNIPTLPILYEFPKKYLVGGENATWRDPANWPMVLPNLNKSITVDRLESDFENAKIAGEGEIRRWASQHLNIEIGVALQMDRWAGANHWEARADAALTLDELIARSDVIVIGIDGGGLDDLFGMAVLGRDLVTGQWLVWTHAWVHRSVLKLRQSEQQKFQELETAGDLTIIDLMSTAFEEAAAIGEKLEQSGLLATIGIDPATAVSDIVEAFAAVGLSGEERVVGVTQGYKLAGTIKTTEVKLSDGKLLHGGQLLMDYCVGNAKVETKGNAFIITKQASGTGKIDPLMAVFNCVSLMQQDPQPLGSVYSGERGLAIW